MSESFIAEHEASRPRHLQLTEAIERGAIQAEEGWTRETAESSSDQWETTSEKSKTQATGRGVSCDTPIFIIV